MLRSRSRSPLFQLSLLLCSLLDTWQNVTSSLGGVHSDYNSDGQLVRLTFGPVRYLQGFRRIATHLAMYE